MVGLKYNHISVSQLVRGSSIKIIFDDNGSVIKKKKTKEILSYSNRKCEMYHLDMTSIIGATSICPLSKYDIGDSHT